MNRRAFLARVSIGLATLPVANAVLGCGGSSSSGSTEVTVSNADASGHTHSFKITCTDLQNGTTAFMATGGTHSHMVTLTADQVADVLDGKEVTVQTTGGHPHTWKIAAAAVSCD